MKWPFARNYAYLCLFKEPFVVFIELYNGGSTGIVWILPRHNYDPVEGRG